MAMPVLVLCILKFCRSGCSDRHPIYDVSISKFS